MNPISVRVPGKVMLSGEYSVLYGGAAILMPVPRYLDITEIDTEKAGDYSIAVRSALEIDIHEVREYEKKHGKPALKIDREMLTGKDKSGRAVKLGLGSSAAEAVGTVKIRLLRSSEKFDDLDSSVFEYAYRAHSEAQGGIGSGADVAACSYSDLIVYKKDYQSGFKQTGSIQVNQRYELNLLWTGTPADTRTSVGKFHQWVEKSSRFDETLFNRLIDLNNLLADLWFDVSQDELFEVIDDYMNCLEACLSKASISYKLPVHSQIESWAKANGGRAKPTGAGGGDMILLIGKLPVERLQHLIIPLEIC